jgi:flagellar basal body-associated protein FliL
MEYVMVDINLIGDDKGEEKEQENVDDFAHTSSLDTQELTFEERTETFDTTKTAGYTLKRSYSSLISTLIIFGVVILLGGAVYFFLFTGDKKPTQSSLPSFQGNVEEFVEPVPSETSEPDQSISIAESEAGTQIETEPEFEAEPETRVETVPPSRPPVSQSLDPLTERILSTSSSAIQVVTDLIAMVPANLNVTLLSYTGKRMRVEFVASTTSEAQNFIDLLNRNFSTGNFTVVSESQVATDGRSLDKVLLAGSVVSNRATSSAAGVEILNLEQAKTWIQSTSKQYGLQIREIRSHQGTFMDGYLKIPVLVRIFGNKQAVVGFLDEIAVQGLNIELAKILLVSPDMTNYSDDSLMLVMNLFLYQPS